MSNTWSNPDFTEIVTTSGVQTLARLANPPVPKTNWTAYAVTDGFYNISTFLKAGTAGDVSSLFTLSNGNYIKVKYESLESGLLRFSTQIMENNVIIKDFAWAGDAYIEVSASHPDDQAWIYFVHDDDSGILSLMCTTFDSKRSKYHYYTIVPNHDFTPFIEGSLPVGYVWTAWDQISGNSGQYRCNLTMIKDSSIGDFSQIQYGTDSDMSRISGQADLMNIFHNMVYDQERTIAWSGSNWMSLTLHEVTGLPNQVQFMFKFYVPSVSDTTPIYTQSFNVVWNGTYKAQHFYLSFVHDDEQQAALFAPVEHMYNGQYNWGYVSSVSQTDMLYLWMWLQSSGSPAGDSPYSTGTTDNGGTPGGGMPQSHIDVPAPPTLGGTSTGMFTVYCPTETQMAKISAFLWSADTITNIRKYFNNFSENIMAFYVLPCKPTNNPTKVFTVGNMSSSDTDLQSVEYISNRFIQIDMGDLLIEPFWDSYLDYAPYSKMEVYLPGIGVQPLDVDDIMCPALQDGSLPEATGSRLHIDYNIDLMTGVMVACISINGEMRYQFPGKMGYTIPLTGENYTRLVQGYVTATAGLIGTIATGGAAAPFAAGATAAGIINAMKPDIYRGGNLSGDSSMLSRKTPMLIYRRPNKAQLIDQEKYTGFPSYKIDLLSNFTGYTEVIDCHVEGISCTEEERDLILAALKGGVII